MAYEKQTWVTGEVITAEKLNHMEDGISGSGGSNALICEYDYNLEHTDKTFGEIKDALLSGKTALLKTDDYGICRVRALTSYNIGGSEGSYFCSVGFDGNLLSSDAYSTIEELDNAYLFFAD